jgi:hypothetical protein
MVQGFSRSGGATFAPELIVTRIDENGDRIVLWKDVENMFVNNSPKYAIIGDLSIPFHFHRNLTE